MTGRSGYSDFVNNSLGYFEITNANPSYILHVVRNSQMTGSITTNSSIYQHADGIKGLYYKSDTTQISKLWGASYAILFGLLYKYVF